MKLFKYTPRLSVLCGTRKKRATTKKFLSQALMIGALYGISMPVWAVCNNPVLTPAMPVVNVQAGGAEPVTTISVAVTCNTRGETFTLSIDADDFPSGSIGSYTNYRNVLSFYKEASRTTPLFGSPITIKTGAAGTTTVQIFGHLRGQRDVGYWSDSFFQGSGNYSIIATGKITSNTTISAFTINQTGNVQATCTVNNATVNFGIVQSGTKPEIAVTLPVTCSQGLIYKLSQSTATPIILGGQTRGYAYAIDSASGTALVDQAMTRNAGPNFAVQDSIPLKVRLEGTTRGAPIIGSGTFNTVIPILITY